MSFYAGKYLIDGDTLNPLHTGAWFMPSAPKQHMAETSNVEELQVLPTDMNVVPTQIQFGACSWTDDEGFTADSDAYGTFYVRGEAFYLRDFTAGSDLYDTFYPNAQSFYVQSWTSGTDLYSQFYPNAQSFYVRSWTSGTGYYDTFYVANQKFYVQGFTPVDFFYAIAEEDC